MRTVALPLLLLVLVCSASAQTTYTTTQDVCGGKAFQYCQMPVTSNPPSSITTLIMDNRSDAGAMYIGAFTLADQVQASTQNLLPIRTAVIAPSMAQPHLTLTMAR
jgi:hypothetical protein